MLFQIVLERSLILFTLNRYIIKLSIHPFQQTFVNVFIPISVLLLMCWHVTKLELPNMEGIWSGYKAINGNLGILSIKIWRIKEVYWKLGP